MHFSSSQPANLTESVWGLGGVGHILGGKLRSFRSDDLEGKCFPSLRRLLCCPSPPPHPFARGPNPRRHSPRPKLCSAAYGESPDSPIPRRRKARDERRGTARTPTNKNTKFRSAGRRTTRPSCAIRCVCATYIQTPTRGSRRVVGSALLAAPPPGNRNGPRAGCCRSRRPSRKPSLARRRLAPAPSRFSHNGPVGLLRPVRRVRLGLSTASTPAARSRASAPSATPARRPRLPPYWPPRPSAAYGSRRQPHRPAFCSASAPAAPEPHTQKTRRPQASARKRRRATARPRPCWRRGCGRPGSKPATRSHPALTPSLGGVNSADRHHEVARERPRARVFSGPCRL